MENGLKLLEQLQQACQEIDVTYEPLVTDDELRAAALAAEALVKECERSGTDPLPLVQALARNWGRLRAGAIQDDSGRQIYLPGPVCFLSFFRHRHAVVECLTTNT
jgi:hypothetical protein